MELVDGLEQYKRHPTFHTLTVPLEKKAKTVLETMNLHRDTPTQAALSQAKALLIEVERWKAGCLQQRMGNAEKNRDRSIWDAFQMAVNAASDIEALLAIMQLKGFGSSVDDEPGLRRAKVATSVLRFFWPEKWGVVDWRTAVILGLLEKHNWHVDRALSEARKQKATELRGLYDFIDEQAACEMNREYRLIAERHPVDLPRAADVDMALFGLSLMVWPMP